MRTNDLKDKSTNSKSDAEVSKQVVRLQEAVDRQEANFRRAAEQYAREAKKDGTDKGG